MSSAGNQQERLKLMGWIVGFVDGEGTFSVSIPKSRSMTVGWQVFPEFIVVQGKKSIESLYVLKDFFGCGNVYISRRYDNHKEHMYRYCVKNTRELREVIVPFFRKNQLRTAKVNDFRKFCKVLEMMAERKHLTHHGVEEIARIAMTMNSCRTPKFLVSSETIRQTPT